MTMKKLLKVTLVVALALGGLTTVRAQEQQRPQRIQQGQQGQQGQQQNQPRMTAEEAAKAQMEYMKKQYNLTDDQVKKVQELNKKIAADAEKRREENRNLSQADREARRATFDKEREERMKNHQAEMKKILTEEQYKKWEADFKARGQGMNAGQGQRPAGQGGRGGQRGAGRPAPTTPVE